MTLEKDPTDPSHPPLTCDAPPDEPTDLELMCAIGQRDEAALEALFNRYRSTVYSVCLRVLKHEADAEDVLLDVFTEVWQRPERFDGTRGTGLMYLMVLARSRAIDRLRSRASRGRSVSIDRVLDMSEIGDNRDNPADACWMAERRRQIRRALGALPAAQRKAVEYAFLEQLSHREIAERLDIPLGTVKTRIRLGLLRFRDVLRHHDEYHLAGDWSTAASRKIPSPHQARRA